MTLVQSYGDLSNAAQKEFFEMYLKGNNPAPSYDIEDMSDFLKSRPLYDIEGDPLYIHKKELQDFIEQKKSPNKSGEYEQKSVSERASMFENLGSSGSPRKSSSITHSLDTDRAHVRGVRHAKSMAQDREDQAKYRDRKGPKKS